MDTRANFAVDLFAGPGGWDVAAQQLGLRTVGIELEHAACETRRAYGLETVEGDVRTLGPADFPDATGLIASPPCQTFSMAGKGAGRDALNLVLTCIQDLYAGIPLPPDAFADERTALVLEPLRWVLEARDLGHPYQWLAFEQVPTVLPVWQAMAGVLRQVGYNVATGNVQAEQHGVPQTRKRAILVGHLHREVALPVPTHSKYHNRTPSRLDPGVLPWVSMAQALGWGQVDRFDEDELQELVGFPRRADTPSNQTGDDIVELDGVEYRARDLRSTEHPSQVVTGKARSWKRWTLATPLHNRAYDGSVPRTLDKPAPTLAMGHASAEWRWLRTDPETGEQQEIADAGKAMGEGMVERHGERPGRTPDQPAFTVRANAGGMEPGGFRWRFSGGGRNSENTVGLTPRELDEPAHTITGKGSAYWINRDKGSVCVNPEAPVSEHVWVTPADGDVGDEVPRQMLRNNTSAKTALRDETEPAPTMYFGARLNKMTWETSDREAVIREVEPRVNNQSGTKFDLAWPADRPAPVIAGREMVTMPGANANRFNGATKSRNDGIRVTPQEAACLQSFPADYPWRGTKTAIFQQIGNAIPPGLAAAILAVVWEPEQEG